MPKNNSNWKTIEKEFRKKFYRYENEDKKDNVLVEEYGGYILDFFKPYFQEQMHKEAVEELESIECQWENCSGGRYCEKHSLEKMDV